MQKLLYVCWDDHCQNLLEKYQKAAILDQPTIANSLCLYINQKWRKRWEDSVKQIDFTYSSQKAWSLKLPHKECQTV